MDSFVDERDLEAMQPDKYAFSVLSTIMFDPCDLILSDHSRLIMCYTCPPYPLWIWTRADASTEDMERAYNIAAENGFLAKLHTINMRKELADYFVNRGTPDGQCLTVRAGMLVYDCPRPVPPARPARGHLKRCTSEEIPEIVGFLDALHRELRLDEKDSVGYLADAEKYVREGSMYFWCDEQNEHAACCLLSTYNDGTAHISLVYTKPDFRRQHYAQTMVYEISVRALEKGCVPILYTDADYAPSNECYRQVGYKVRGELCTIGVPEPTDC